jgi:hypothetical protein
VFVTEIGDIPRFGAPEQLTSWAGLTPKHHESDTTVHRGRITKQFPAGAVGRGRGRATGPRKHAPRSDPRLGVLRPARSPSFAASSPPGPRRRRREQPTHRGGRKPSLS